jgi:hypothetical protein
MSLRVSTVNGSSSRLTPRESDDGFRWVASVLEVDGATE